MEECTVEEINQFILEDTSYISYIYYFFDVIFGILFDNILIILPISVLLVLLSLQMLFKSTFERLKQLRRRRRRGKDAYSTDLDNALELQEIYSKAAKEELMKEIREGKIPSSPPTLHIMEKISSFDKIDDIDNFLLDEEEKKPKNELEETELSEILRTIRLFQFIETKVLNELSKQIKIRKVNKGEILFGRNTNGEYIEDKSLLVILEGRVEIFVHLKNENEDDKVLLNVFEDGHTVTSMISILEALLSSARHRNRSQSSSPRHHNDYNYNNNVNNINNINNLNSNFENINTISPERKKSNPNNINTSDDQNNNNNNINNSGEGFNIFQPGSPFRIDSFNDISRPLTPTVKRKIAVKEWKEELAIRVEKFPMLRKLIFDNEQDEQQNSPPIKEEENEEIITAIATKDSVMAELPLSSFDLIQEKYPRAAIRLIRSIIMRLQRATLLTVNKYFGLSQELLSNELLLKSNLKNRSPNMLFKEKSNLTEDQKLSLEFEFAFQGISTLLDLKSSHSIDILRNNLQIERHSPGSVVMAPADLSFHEESNEAYEPCLYFVLKGKLGVYLYDDPIVHDLDETETEDEEKGSLLYWANPGDIVGLYFLFYYLRLSLILYD